MKLCDEVAAIAGVRHSGGRVVTAGMDRMTFNEPIEIGELLTLRAAVNSPASPGGARHRLRLGHTSMEIGVRVEAEWPAIGDSRHTNTAFLTMVAVEPDGRPRPVPPLVCATDDEHRREAAAQTRRRNRLAEREAIVGGSR